MEPTTRTRTAFFLYRDSALRREALRRPPGTGERYSLYGLDEVAGAGFAVAHNLEERYAPGALAEAVGRVLHRAVGLLGGHPGDFGRVLACRRDLNRSDVVFSTVDTVGIPLALLGRAGLVRPPVVYAAIGLPERIATLRNGAMRRLYRGAYRRIDTIVAYGAGEVDALRAWLGDDGPRIVFVPFGVDAAYFAPAPRVTPEVDVVSVGADPRRDFALLVQLARRRPEWSFLVIATGDHARTLEDPPSNMRVELDQPLEVVRERLRAARVVALPVLDNTYSGATTVLLQALACGRPVVVSRTAAIARGYQLEDGVNCALVPPADGAAFETALAGFLDHEERAAAVGLRARATVEEHLSWSRYAEAIRELLSAACERTTVAS